MGKRNGKTRSPRLKYPLEVFPLDRWTRMASLRECLARIFRNHAWRYRNHAWRYRNRARRCRNCVWKSHILAWRGLIHARRLPIHAWRHRNRAWRYRNHAWKFRNHAWRNVKNRLKITRRRENQELFLNLPSS